MTKEHSGQDRIAALEAELLRVQSERAMMDARIRTGHADMPERSTRRADVLAWSAFFVAAALVSSLVVVIAQQQPVVREHTRVETVVVPEVAVAAPVAVTPDATPVATPPTRTTDGRTRPVRPPRGEMTDLLGDDRCGSDPTCGI
jgi:hypothetical protein